MRNMSRQILAMLLAVVMAVSVVALTAPAAQAAKKRPSFSVAPTEVVVNQAVKVRGMAKARKGTRVKIQLQLGPRWSTIAKTRVKANKRYKTRVQFASPGAKTLRAKVVKQRPSRPKTILVTPIPRPPAPPPAPVARWRDLTRDDLIDCQSTKWAYGCFSDRGGRYTDGKYTFRTWSASYISGLAQPGEYTRTDFRLGRKCESFTALIGLDDESPFGSVERIEVLGDGRVLFSRDMTNDESATPVLDVKGVQRLSLKHTMMADVTNADDAFANFGNPRIKCTN